MKRADVLFVHTSFPGQFGFLASALKKRGMRCAAVGNESSWSTEIPVRTYPLVTRAEKSKYAHVASTENAMVRGEGAAQVALRMRSQGFAPELIIGHPGWGDTLLLRELFPDARQILHAEYYYRSRGGDFNFDFEFGRPDDLACIAVAARNAAIAMAYAEADKIVSPTKFQASQFPAAFRDNMSIIHEGVDTAQIRPRADATFKLPNGMVLDRKTPVITFVNRNFEPLRGYHIFMRALPAVLKAVPDAHVLMIGSATGLNYGAKSKDITWKDRILSQMKDQLDMSRIHFTGPVPHDRLLDAFNVSSAHVYYTYPFVLSWSLLEAMACECLVIGSDTPPLHDAIEDGVSGRLLDFFDVKALSDALIHACRNPDAYRDMRKAARRSVVETFDRDTVCLPAWLDLIETVMQGG